MEVSRHLNEGEDHWSDCTVTKDLRGPSSSRMWTWSEKVATSRKSSLRVLSGASLNGGLWTENGGFRLVEGIRGWDDPIPAVFKLHLGAQEQRCAAPIDQNQHVFPLFHRRRDLFKLFHRFHRLSVDLPDHISWHQTGLFCSTLR